MDLKPLPCLADYVRATAEVTPEAPAMIFGSQRWTYGQLDTAVTAVARWLHARGFKKGDVLTTLSRPRPEYWILFLATGRVGGVWMGLNPRYTAPERAWVLADAKPRFFALQAPQTADESALLAQTLEAAGEVEVTLVFGGDWPGATRLESIAAVNSSASVGSIAPASSIAPDDWPTVAVDEAALLVYTSGTTGKPKGALISHYGLTYGSLVQATELRVPRPTVICNLPISHVGCVADICAVTLVQGGTLIFQEQFSAEDMLMAIEHERVTTWVGVPSMFQMIVQHPRFAATDLSCVRLVLWGGAAMPQALIETLSSRGLRLKTAYGLTESSCHVAFTNDDTSPQTLACTIGRPTPFTPCRVADETGHLCAPGVPGELQIQGRQNFIGYLGNPEATRDAFTADGWLRTGDLATWTEDGSLRLIGRLREMFKSGGYSVFPREIELALEAHPAVETAAVVPVPDPLYQEVGVAFVVLRPGRTVTPEDLSRHLRQHLANFKIPKLLQIMTQLPVLPIGKIDKTRLRAQARELTAQPAGTP